LVNSSIYYSKRSGYSMLVSFLAVLINTAAIVLLTSRWDIVGASLASVITGCVVLVLKILGMCRFFSARFDYIGLVFNLGLGSVGLVVSVSVLNVLILPFWTVLIIKIVVILIYYALAGSYVLLSYSYRRKSGLSGFV